MEGGGEGRQVGGPLPIPGLSWCYQSVAAPQGPRVVALSRPPPGGGGSLFQPLLLPRRGLEGPNSSLPSAAGGIEWGLWFGGLWLVFMISRYGR